MISYEDLINKEKPIAIVGLGYVGLPLAVAFSHYFNVIGFDINQDRINELKNGRDHTKEINTDELKNNTIDFTSVPEILSRAAVIIIAVPTPIDKNRNPDLMPVVSATKLVGSYMSENVVIVYESTVYPGLTEEICVPLLEKESGMKFNKNFSVGYSPERINPGDKIHTLINIKKIVSGSNPETTKLLTRLYGTIITAGIHTASSIKVAEAAKVIENTQRDLNIALMNELSMIFERMGIDTMEVLQAAGSKWNFLPFRPGLVGGHCIGVDPYYLTFKAEELGFHPEVILAGRRINDRMSKYIAEQTIKKLISTGHKINGCKIGILGLTFKENVPDLRNTKVIDLIKELKDYGAKVLVNDPQANLNEAKRTYGIDLVGLDKFQNLDAVILAVGHNEYKELNIKKIEQFFKKNEKPIIIDVKSFFDQLELQKNNIECWRL